MSADEEPLDGPDAEFWAIVVAPYRPDPQSWITCPVCGRTSYHPVDVAEGYCGACHDWTSPR